MLYELTIVSILNLFLVEPCNIITVYTHYTVISNIQHH